MSRKLLLSITAILILPCFYLSHLIYNNTNYTNFIDVINNSIVPEPQHLKTHVLILSYSRYY